MLTAFRSKVSFGVIQITAWLWAVLWCACALAGQLEASAQATSSSAGPGSYEARTLGCDVGEPRVIRVELSSKIILAARLTGAFTADPTHNVPAVVQRAIELQQRFVIGYLKNDEQTLRNSSAMIGAPVGTPIIRSISRGRYPATLNVDSMARYPAAQFDPYIQAAIREGQIHEGEDAWVIEYRWMAPLAVCRGDVTLREIQPLVPLDPFLAFWQTDARSRRLQKWKYFWAVISPCLNAEGAELAHPSTLWYTWAPNQTTSDVLGKSYACPVRDLLKSQLVAIDVQELKRATPLEGSRVLSRRRTAKETLKISFVVGNLTRDEFKQIDVEHLKRDFAAPGPHALWQSIFPQTEPRGVQSVALTAKSFYEPGAREFLTFLKYLPEFMTIERRRVVPAPAVDFVGTIEGRLKRSRQAVRIQVFYGDTVPWLTKNNPFHHQFMINALLEDDVVVYAGHAGLGDNHSLAKMLSATGMTRTQFVERSRRKSDLLSVVLACESFSYFGEDVAAARAEGGVRTETMLSAHKDVGAKYVLGLIEAFERYQTGEATNLAALLSRYTPPGEYLVFSSREP